ncbi:unnamed protein product [Phytophthora lilii]|uniref:Unnamed protein product n=1 Tax=Phytophthora lilii TaxID=2077276 RepID=A0A9W6U1U7_9STRA|nr:unnamed protein product [Phytophthora lilii]
MSKPDASSWSRQSGFVTLSYCGFTFWWLVILAVHLVTFLFNVCYAKFYWDFGDTFLSYSLEAYNIGMRREHFHTISYVHIGLASMDGAYFILMVVGSLMQRTLTFSPWSVALQRHGKVSRKAVRNHVAKMNEQNQKDDVSQLTIRRSTVLMLRRATKAISNRRSILGVKGRYFYVILICREAVETSFQPVHVVRMSKYLSRTLLNRFYAVLLVINCWSTVFVHTRGFAGDDARRRFAAVVCDCTLDLLSAMGVSIMIVLSYVNEYDVELGSFDFSLLQDDTWMARMLSEARLVVVTSWSDLTSRIVFLLGVIAATYNMKQLLRWKPRRGNRIAHGKGGNEKDELQLVGPQRLDNILLGPSKKQRTKVKSYNSCFFWQANTHHPRIFNHISRGLLVAVHCLFFSLGVVVLGLHIHASWRAPLVECNPKVKPIAGAHPACFLVEFDCHKLGILGTKKEVTVEWKKIDPTTVAKLHILHCSVLEIPSMLQEFDQLREMWIYNSSIRSWDSAASITNTHHPNLTVFSLIRTNTAEGQLPEGLQSSDFPNRLTQMYFCKTNLQTMPEDIDSKWRFGSNIYIEASNLTMIPPALLRLQPYYLSLASNPITELPPDLFDYSLIHYLVLSHTKLHELPPNVTSSPSGQTFFYFSSTDISYFWSWIDPFVESMLGISPRLAVGSTPYCYDLENILNGAASNFSVPFQPGFSRTLMNASVSNWEILIQSVDCSSHVSLTQFPLEAWDTLYAMVDVRL